MNTTEKRKMEKGFAILISFWIFIAALVCIWLIDYNKMLPSAKAADIYFPEAQKISCDFNYYWNRSGYPIKNIECDITK